MRIFGRIFMFGFVVCALTANGVGLAQDCEPSPWGADDEIGAANHMSPASVMAALGLVKRGEVHPLGIVIDPNMPAFPPRSMTLQVLQPDQHHGKANQQLRQMRQATTQDEDLGPKQDHRDRQHIAHGGDQGGAELLHHLRHRSIP